jgi:hypothetical protein
VRGKAIPLASIVIPIVRLAALIVTDSVIERPPEAGSRVIVVPSSEESKTITSPGAPLELATMIASRNEQSLFPGGSQSEVLFTTSAFVVTVIVHGGGGWAKAGAAYMIQIKAHSRARTLESSPRFMAKASFILAFWSNYNLLKKKKSRPMRGTVRSNDQRIISIVMRPEP